MGDSLGRVGLADGGNAAGGFCYGRHWRRSPGLVSVRSFSPGPAKGTRVTTALCIVFILLVPAALAGISLINTGLGRSRSAAHSMMAALCVTAVAAPAYFVCGFPCHGFPGAPPFSLPLAAKHYNRIPPRPFS